MIKNQAVWIITTSIGCFILGTWFPIHNRTTNRSIVDETTIGWKSLRQSGDNHLEEQIKAHEQFQVTIKKRNVECTVRTLQFILLRNPSILEQVLDETARSIKVALATERRLVVIVSDGAFCEGQSAETTRFSCFVMRLFSPCLDDPDRQSSTASSVIYHSSSPARQGIIKEIDSSNFFNVHYYGDIPTVELPQWPWKKSWLLEPTEWSRHWGDYWVSSEIKYYLWEAWMAVRRQRSTGSTNNEDALVPNPFIAIVLNSDIWSMIKKKFGRNPTLTHDWNRILTLANHIRRQDPRITTMYLSIQGSLSSIPNLEEWLTTSRTTATASEIMDSWHILENTVQDPIQLFQVLKQSDFLIGSFANPAFTLASQLNTIHHVDRYPLSLRRVWPLDIEWYSDM